MKKVLLIDGCRTPFLKSGTDYIDILSYELAQYAIEGLLLKTGITKNDIEQVILGNVVSNILTPNVAREASIAAGLDYETHCSTVSQACISGNKAISNSFNEIKLGHSDLIIAGGVESISDTPILFRKKMRKKLFLSQKIKSIVDLTKFIFSLNIKDFIPVKPKVTEYLTGRTMGEDCEILVSRYNITRDDQDKYSLRSHKLAFDAQKNGFLDDIFPVEIKPKFKKIKFDNGIRGNTSIESLKKLKPVFDSRYGTLTAGNSSFLTDGAAMSMLASQNYCNKNNIIPKSEIIDYVFTGQSIEQDLLLGPAYAISRLLEKTNLKLKDIDVFEIHEAFAGQVLSNLKCLESNSFSKTKLNIDNPVGEIDINKLNLWGGSMSIGHPFGATGSRLLNTASNRLIRENGNYAVISACAAGGHGHAMLIKKY